MLIIGNSLYKLFKDENTGNYSTVRFVLILTQVTMTT